MSPEPLEHSAWWTCLRSWAARHLFAKTVNANKRDLYWTSVFALQGRSLRGWVQSQRCGVCVCDWPAPNENPGDRGSSERPRLASYALSSRVTAGKLRAPTWFYWQATRKLASGFPWTVPDESLPFADFNPCSFVVINSNGEYNSFLSPVMPSRVVSRSSFQACYLIQSWKPCNFTTAASQTIKSRLAEDKPFDWLVLKRNHINLSILLYHAVMLWGCKEFLK